MSQKEEEKDFSTVVMEVSNRPFNERKLAERKLAGEASRHLDALSSLLETAGVPARRSIIEILGHMKPGPRIKELLLKSLRTDPDIKARRRAAAMIANTEDKALREELLTALGKEEHRYVQASIILALGALQYQWPPDSEQRFGTQGPVAEAFRKAKAKSEAEMYRAAGVSDEVSRPPALYMLAAYSGLENFVETELRMRGVTHASAIEPGWLQLNLSKASLETAERLGEIRTILATYVVGDRKPIASQGKPGDFLVNALKGHEGFDLKKRAGLTFRLELPQMSSRSQYRKAVVNIARQLADECGLRNNPSDYVLDLRVEYIKGQAYALWRDTRWGTPRAQENRLVLPASIHPSVAAALCIAGEINPDDVFCDPCCGAGTILAERLALGPVRSALGFDISPAAIGLSEKNLSNFGNRVKLEAADMTRLPVESNSINVTVANLPFGIRVGHRANNRKLYRDFLKEARRILAPGGRLIAYTSDTAAYEQAAGDLKWKSIQLFGSIQAGGLTVTIYKGVQP